MARSRYIAAVGVVAVAAGMMVGVAGATTNVLANANPGFENTNCTTQPCGWAHSSSGATVARDTSTFHGGAASYRVSGAANETNSGSSDCIPVALTAGLHELSYWYNNSDPNILASSVRIEIVFNSGSSCNTFISGTELFGTGTGGWLQQKGIINVPQGTMSLFVTLYAPCTTAGACSGYFDDVDLESELTAVTLSSFVATRSAKGVSIRWRTGTETGTLGFHVYRSRGAKWARVDRHLVRAQGSVAGARYSFLDARAPRTKLTYRLQAVGIDGSRTWYGRATVPGR